MATNPVASLPDADAVREALQACELLDRLRGGARHRHRRCLPHPAAGARLGARRTARSPTPSAASRASGRSCRRPARRGRIGGSWPRSRAASASARPSPGTASPTSSASTPRSRPSRTTARATSTSAPVPASTTRPTRRWRRSSGRPAPARQRRALLRRRRLLPSRSSRALRARRRRARRCMRPTRERPLRLNTGRVRDQWHTMTRTGKSARLAGHRPEPTIELHPDDAARARPGRRRHRRGRPATGAARRCACTCRTPCAPGEAFAPMHWTAQVSRAGRINAAVNPAVDPISGQPELKHTPVEVRRLDMRWHGTILARRPVMLPEITYWTRDQGRRLPRLPAGGRAAAGCGAAGAVGGDSRDQPRALARGRGGHWLR